MSKAAELANLIGNINMGGGGVNRNVIINGAMNVCQRSTSVGSRGDDTGYYVVDRWILATGATTAGRLTLSQDSSAPSGFANSLKFDCTTADTSIAAGELLTITQRIEGQNLQAFAKGTSDAKPFTLSFYAKANASKTYVAELFDIDNSRHVGKTFTVGTSWARHEITFPADTTGAFDDNNARSLDVSIWLNGGSTFTGGTLGTTWQAEDADDRAAGIGSFFSSTDNTFFITGVQLEVGQNATEFEHEPYAVTKNKCLRYYWRQGGGSVCLGSGTYYSSTNFAMHMDLPVPMRIGPTHGAEFNSSSFIVYSNASVDYIEGIGAGRNAANESGECYTVQWDSSGGGGTQGHGAISITQSSGQYIDLDAEL